MQQCFHSDQSIEYDGFAKCNSNGQRNNKWNNATTGYFFSERKSHQLHLWHQSSAEHFIADVQLFVNNYSRHYLQNEQRRGLRRRRL
jgi:hypothetical protein